MLMWKPVQRKTTGLAACLALLGLALTLSCAPYSTPTTFRYDAAGVPQSIKRVERFPQRDFVHHFVRQAYFKPAEPFAPTPKTDQAVTFEEWGKPDWVRRPFRSLDNELVAEWVYLDRGHIFQFIGSQLVFEGPLTDYEQVLLRRGYPDRVLQTRLETGTNEDVFIYFAMFSPRLEQFHFMNGTMTESQEGS